MSRIGLCLIIVIVLVAATVASPVEARQVQAGSAETWSRTYQRLVGTDALALTSGGGFVVAGQGFRGLDVWLMKADVDGEPEWERNYTPLGYGPVDVASVRQTRDRGYVLAGAALSLGYVTGLDAWVLKLDRRGDVEWSMTYGGRADDYFSSIRQASDGGYVAVGNTQSFGSPYHASNGWVVKLGKEGDIEWQETFEGQDIYSVDETSDRGFVLAGTVGVLGKADAWVVKLDASGKVAWQKAYERTGNSGANSVQQTFDGGYIVSGGGLFFRLDAEGNILWERFYSGGGSFANSLHETPDGGFVVSGRSSGPWLLKVNSTGGIAWQKIYGGLNDFLLDVQPTSNGDLVASGWLYATGSAWVLETNAEGAILGCTLGVASNETLTNTALTVTLTLVNGVRTNATVAMIAENVTGVQAASQILCVSTQDRHKDQNS